MSTLKANKDKARFISNPISQDVADGDWVDHEVITKYKLPEIVIDAETSTGWVDGINEKLVTSTTVAENDKVRLYDGSSFVHGSLGTVILSQGDTFITGAAQGTSGTFIAPSNGIVNLAMAGGGGAGGGTGNNGYGGGGGGGSALLIALDIPVTQGQNIPFTIGSGGVGAVNANGGNGGTTSILTYSALGANGGTYGSGSNGLGGAGANGGGNGGNANFDGENGAGFVFAPLIINNAGVGGALSTSSTSAGGGAYGGGGGGGRGTSGQTPLVGTFGGGGGGSDGAAGSIQAGANGGAGYIYIAFAEDKYTADITSFELSTPPTKAFFNKTIDTTLSAEDTGKCKSSTVTQIGVL